MATTRIRLGTLLTPVAARDRPWDLASRVGTVDRLSGGRAILARGLGALHDGWLAFEPDEGRRSAPRSSTRASRSTPGLIGGQPFSFDGPALPGAPTDFAARRPPVQRPHPPVWVVGRLRARAGPAAVAGAGGPLGRACAARPGPTGRTASRASRTFAEVVDRVRGLRAEPGLPWEGYDVVVEADSTGEFVQLERRTPADWEQAGATWWVESWWSVPEGADGMREVRRRVEAGPPA